MNEEGAVPPLNIATSACCNPEMTLEELLPAYARIGCRRLELFTAWTNSALDYRADPATYRELLAKHGMQLVSLHLPAVSGDSADAVDEAVKAAEFAAKMGASVVLFKARSRELYIRTARAFLDRIEGLPVTPVLQNHAGSPLTTLDDVRHVTEGIADPRMKTLLEVGHYHTAGVHWKDACDLLGDTIALVHIKDQIGNQSVPFGQGEIDLKGLFRHLKTAGYDGDIVIEMEVADRENTLDYLLAARNYTWEGIQP